jgi:Uncharacterized protein conserved in bacteria (DUF2325)
MTLLASYNRSRAISAGLSDPAAHVDLLQAENTGKSQRLKTWELSSMFHCSIVGTCLTTTELRHVLSKVGDMDTKAATDHILHSCGVQAAGQRDIAGKLLNKALDRRHETILKKFSKLKTVAEIERLWNACVDQGDIAGAYWAVMSHPVYDKELVRQVFGEVHMLSHLVGSSSRLDIARLQKLQTAGEAKDEKIARQQRRLQELSLKTETLQRHIEALEADASRTKALSRAAQVQISGPVDDARPLQKADAANAHAEDLASRLSATELKLKAAEKRASVEAARNDALLRELASLERLLLSRSGTVAAKLDASAPQVTLLYVGGRPGLFDHIRAAAEAHNVELLIHDGGLEESLSLMPGLISRASFAVFPVDCISHPAAGLVKRLCRAQGKSYVPLRSASLASFVAALAERVPGVADNGASQSSVSLARE